ncbi:MAG: hypothetical protein ACKVQK_23515 [Burkholderiales bacterium]
MPIDTLDPAFFERHIANIKTAWRKRAQALSWEEKIAAIERMRERDLALKRSRDQRSDPPAN